MSYFWYYQGNDVMIGEGAIILLVILAAYGVWRMCRKAGEDLGFCLAHMSNKSMRRDAELRRLREELDSLKKQQ